MKTVSGLRLRNGVLQTNDFREEGPNGDNRKFLTLFDEKYQI